jgi:hypothetical protein
MQQHVGKCLTAGSEERGVFLFVVPANFHGVNTPTVTDFKEAI